MINPFFRLSTKDKMFFARHMAIMTRSGMQALDILKILHRQTRSSSFKKVINHLIACVKNGQFLSDGLKKYQSLFGDFFLNIVRVGEVSGTLAENLEYLAESLRKKEELEGKVKGALVYPIIILVVVAAMSAGLTFFIFPKILPIFKSLNVELPLITKIFIAVSTFMINRAGFIFFGLIGFVVTLWLILKIRVIRYAWHRLIIMLPVAGTMAQDYNMAQLARSLSLLLKSGVKIVQAVEITARSSSNLVYRKRLEQIAKEVVQGDLISKHLSAFPRLFPPVFSEMMAVGEQTGKLDETGLYLADFYEHELDGSTKTLSSVLEPVLLVLMGGVVAFIAIAIIMPIYEISQNIQ